MFALPFQSLFSPDKRSAEKHGLPSQFQMATEVLEASSTILDKQVNTQPLYCIYYLI